MHLLNLPLIIKNKKLLFIFLKSTNTIYLTLIVNEKMSLNDLNH